MRKFNELLPNEQSRNFVINLIEGGLYITSGAFISPQTVLPALVSRLGGSTVVVGALPVIIYGGAFLPQIFAARYVETHPWKKPWVVTTGFFQRLVIFLIAVAIALFGESAPTVALVIMVALLFVNQTLIGISTPGWFDLFAKLTPVDRRGRLVGLRNSIGGGAGLFASLLLTWLLATIAFPYSYAAGLVCACVLQLGSVGMLRQLHESAPSKVVQRKPFSEYLEGVPRVIRQNHDFRMFLIAAALLTVANMPLGFYTVYALVHWQAGEEVVGQFTLSIVAVQVVSAVAIGFIADRKGNKTALMYAGGAVLAATTIALIAPTLGIFHLVFLFAGINLGTELMARYNMAIEFGPPEQRSTYIGLMNTFLAPFYLSGLFAGWLVERFGFHVMFAAGLAFSVAGLYLLYTRVNDPRRPREALPTTLPQV